MKRRLFTILSAVSLVLCLASVGMWVRSGFAEDIVDKWHGLGCSSTLASDDSSLSLQWALWTDPTHPDLRPPAPWTWHVTSTESWASKGRPLWHWGWPSYFRDTWRNTGLEFESGPSITVQRLILPYWALTLAMAALPAIWFWKRRTAKALLRRIGLCRVCGYDLRASPERCPECGTAVPSPTRMPAQ